jgi:hypothetical protein
MGFRKFSDRDKQEWEIRPRSRTEWEFSPSGGNQAPPRSVLPPGYETDPYELSQEELQRLLDSSTAQHKRSIKNPFGDT